MDIRTETIEGYQCIFLKGRLDIAGTQSVDLRFTTLTSTRKQPVMIDLSEVDFISSMGMRLLVANAKTLHATGAKMVLVRPQQVVLDVLCTAGIDQLIPITASTSDAAAILKPAGG